MLSLSMRFICSLFDLVGTEEYVVRKCTNEPSQAWQVGKLASRSGSVYLEGARHHAQHKLWNECGNRGSGYYLHYFAFHFRTHGVAHRGLAVNTECVYTKIASECYAYVSNELHAHFYHFLHVCELFLFILQLELLHMDRLNERNGLRREDNNWNLCSTYDSVVH